MHLRTYYIVTNSFYKRKLIKSFTIRFERKLGNYKDMIKVCHLTSVHESSDTRIFVKECTSLAAAGFDVYLVARGESRIENNVKVCGLGVAPKSRIKRAFCFTEAVYKKGLELDCDIYHLHDPELLTIAGKLKKHGKVVIFDSHEKYTEQIRNKTYLPKIVRNVIAILYERYENKLLRKIDAVIFPCLYKGKHLFEGKCKVVETVDNYPILSELYDKYDENIIKNNRSVCYVGSITRARGVTNLIKAAALANCTINLGGAFSPQGYQNELESMQEYHCVRYYGVLKRSQVLEVLQNSLIGMATLLNVGQYNQYDNLPTKAFEYMSLGIPVILSKADFSNKLTEQYKFGICVDPANIDEISKAIRYLLDNPKEATEMGKRGRMAVKERFNWDVEKVKLIELYTKLLKK